MRPPACILPAAGQIPRNVRSKGTSTRKALRAGTAPERKDQRVCRQAPQMEAAQQGERKDIVLLPVSPAILGVG